MPYKARNGKIPVTSGPRLLEWADPQRAAALLRAPNVRPILKHKKYLVEIQVLVHGDDSRVRRREGNPQALVASGRDG
jgi:hypothetical protein